jgi:hypothetical protein
MNDTNRKIGRPLFPWVTEVGGDAEFGGDLLSCTVEAIEPLFP